MGKPDEARLKIKQLGQFEVCFDGEPVPAKTFRQQKTIQLFKIFLSERGRVFSKDQLAEHLFPENTEAGTFKNLQNRISELRKALEPDLKRGQPSQYLQRVGQEGYAFSKEAACWLDTEAFEVRLKKARELEASEHWMLALETYEQALSLYQGDYLTEDLYEDWTLSLRNHWHELFLEGLQHAAECHTKLGQYREAIDCCHRLIQAAPGREQAYAQKMYNHSYAGEKQLALETYQALIGVLKDEIGLDPSPDTRSLYMQIREGVLPAPQRIVVSNLPQAKTRFIGREEELSQLHRMLDEEGCRLLTIVGPGGMGKTRLALQLGDELGAQFEDGVHWIELASVSRGKDISQAIGKALKFKFAGNKPPEEQILNYIGNKTMLLVFDNFEHLKDHAEMINQLLAQCPNLKTIATSREWLNLEGETIFTLQGLDLPEESAQEKVGQYSAIQLFIESGRRKAPELRLNATTQAQMVRLCRLVNGMPLGIELAAAWLGVISLDDIVAEIESGLDFLETSMSDVPERHRSMRVIFNSTWKHLDQDEQNAFMKLSVFRGGFSHEAGRRVAEVSLSNLMVLLNHSLLYRPTPDRYKIHELLRQFGQEQLKNSPHHESARLAHLKFFTDMAKEAEIELEGPDQVAWMTRLELEQDNIIAALQWGLQHKAHDAPLLGIALGRYWDYRGSFAEGVNWFQQILKAPSLSDKARAKALLWKAFMDSRVGEFDSVEENLKKSLALYEKLGDQNGVAQVYRIYGDLSAEQGDFITAQERYGKSLNICRDIGDQHNLFRALLGCCRTDYHQLEFDTAKQFVEEAIDIMKDLGQPIELAKALNALGSVATKQEDYEAAAKAFEQALEINEALQNKPSLTHTYLNLGMLLSRMEKLDVAREYQDKALVLVEELGYGDNYVGLIKNNIGYNSFLQNNYEEALQFYEGSLNAYRAINHQHGISMVLNNLGFTSLELGDLEQAETYLREALIIRRDIENEFVGSSLLGLTVVLSLSQPEKTISLFGALEKLSKDKTLVLGDYYYEQKFDHHHALVRESVDQSMFDKAWKAGQTLSLAQAIEGALALNAS